MRQVALATLALLGVVTGLRAVAQDFTGCAALDGLDPICGFRGSEDIEVLPDRHTLIVSESQVRFGAGGAMRWLPSGLAGFDARTRRIQRLYPVPLETSTGEAWGDAGCRDPIGARLSPLGLHLSRRTDGRLQLLVVNHGARESVEFFEVRITPGVSLQWRGCVVAPAGAFLNDVAALGDDSFVATQYLSLQPAAGVPADRGVVLRWDRGAAMRPLPGTEGTLLNGVQSRPDASTIWVAAADGGGELREHDAGSGRLLRSVSLPGADNLSWSSGDTLLVAAGAAGSAATTCTFEPPCGDAFTVEAVDLASLAVQRVFEHAGAPLGLGTVAVQVGDDLFIGSAAGDRILRVPAGRWGRKSNATR